LSNPRELVLPSSGLYVKDDFCSNDSTADAAVGELDWELVTIGNASTLALQTATPFGVLRLTTAATADGDGEALRLFTDGLVLKPGFELGARVRYPVELASGNFRVGLDDSVTATRPTVGVTLESDAGVLSCHTDSGDHGDESESVTGHPDLTSGTTMVVGEWLDVLIRASGRANAQGGPDEVDFFVGSTTGDGQAPMTHVAKVPCNIDNDEEVELKIVHWQDSGTTDAVAFEIDYIYFWQPRIP
jgi:hypothetical protein